MSRRILIIDDDRELCEELSEILKDEKFDVHYALAPAEGKRLLNANEYDSIILDFKLPQISGIDFLKEVEGVLKKQKVFMISGSLSIGKLLKRKNLSHLISGVFGKPFDVEALLQALKK